MVVSQSTENMNKQGDSSEERAGLKLPLLCPVCREREAILRYSRRDSPYVVCDCGVRIFIWGTGAKQLILKRVKDYQDAKAGGRLEEYKKSQIALR